MAGSLSTRLVLVINSGDSILFGAFTKNTPAIIGLRPQQTCFAPECLQWFSATGQGEIQISTTKELPLSVAKNKAG